MNKAPRTIKLHRRTQLLELVFSDQDYWLSSEFLRVHSPSAEVKGHGPGQEVLQLNKSRIAITAIEPQGNYAIKLTFSDGHDSGIYSWPYLKDLAENHQQYWATYLKKAEEYEQTEGLDAVKWIGPK